MDETRIPGQWHRGRFYPVMAGAEEPGADTTADVAQSESASQQEPAPSAPEITGPWAKDLERHFEDPQVRAKVDEFMRTSYQPYVTQLETEKAELSQVAEFIEDLRNDPVGTYLELSKLIGGEELAEAAKQFLTPEEQAEVEAIEQGQTQQLDPELQQMLEDYKQEKANEEYWAKISELDVEPDLFHPLVIAHDGDIEAAYQAYPAYLAKVQEVLGQDAGPTPDEVPEAPPVIGSDAQAGSTPPLEEAKPRSLEEAVDRIFDKMQAPQTVGSA